MFVDPDLLHSGASESHRAGGHAQDAADRLSRGPLQSGMFGQFAAAEAFHDAVSASHEQYVQTLQAHQKTLTAVGRSAHRAGAEFVDMEDRNAAELRTLRRSSGI